MILDKEIYVIDDFIDLKYQEDIKNILMGDYQYEGKDFPWYYTSDVTIAGEPESQNRPALFHSYVEHTDGELVGKKITVFHHLFLDMLKKVCKDMNIKNINVLQGRSFLQFPLNLKDKIADTPHTDMDKEHLVVLYYVCDSDGDTLIFNQREQSEDGFTIYTIKKRVTPKQGRIVLFDGSLYHTAEQPLNNHRCIVNYNLG